MARKQKSLVWTYLLGMVLSAIGAYCLGHATAAQESTQPVLLTLVLILLGLVVKLGTVALKAGHRSKQLRVSNAEIATALQKSLVQEERLKAVVERLYQYLEVEFKRPANILKHYKTGGDNNELSERALDKLTYNLEIVLQARNRWIEGALRSVDEYSKKVFAIGNSSSLSSLSLALEYHSVSLIHISDMNNLSLIQDGDVCLFDLDPLINDASSIIGYINALHPNCYKVGFITGAVKSNDIDALTFYLDWVVKDPMIAQLCDVLEKKPKITQQMPTFWSYNDCWCLAD